MDPVVYRNYIYIHHHLKSLLREWKLIKPRFEALASSNSTSIMFLCLTRLKKRINSANSRLQRIIDQIQVICNIQQLFELRTELLRGPNMGLCLKIIAIDVMGQIDVFLDKFKGIEPLPFNDLPYECQNRLVALFPPPDLVSFKLAGKTATKYANKRGMFSACLSIIRNSIHYENTRNTYGKNKYYDISSTNLFLNLSSCYVQTGLYLNLDSTEKFDRTIELVRSCDYTCLTLQGPYTYKHAIYLMRVSKNVQHVCLSIGIQIEIEDYEDYYEAIVQWLNSHGDAIMITIYCKNLDVTFPGPLEERIKTRTNFKAIFRNICLVIYKHE